MASSASERVRELLHKHPNISNKELYEALPDVKQYTVRYYKSKFLEEQVLKTPGKSTAKLAGASTKKTGRIPGETAAKQAKRNILRKKVFAYLDKAQDQSIEALYTAFPAESKYSLRGFMVSYTKAKARKKGGRVKRGVKQKTAETKASVLESSLEARIKTVEDQVKQIVGRKSSVKSKFTQIKGIARNLSTFIKEKRKSLTGLQQAVAHGISFLVSRIKNK